MTFTPDELKEILKEARTAEAGLLWPIALDKDGQLAWARSAKREDGPFTCMECEEEVILKQGTQLRHHYAHKAEGRCVASGESALHALGKYIFKEWLTLAARTITCTCTRCKTRTVPVIVQPVSIRPERKVGTIIPDLTLVGEHEEVEGAVEIVVSNAPDADKLTFYGTWGKPVLVVHVTDDILVCCSSGEGNLLLEGPSCWLNVECEVCTSSEVQRHLLVGFASHKEALDQQAQVNIQEIQDQQDTMSKRVEHAQAVLDSQVKKLTAQSYAEVDRQYAEQFTTLTAQEEYLRSETKKLYDRRAALKAEAKHVREQLWAAEFAPKLDKYYTELSNCEYSPNAQLKELVEHYRTSVHTLLLQQVERNLELDHACGVCAKQREVVILQGAIVKCDACGHVVIGGWLSKPVRQEAVSTLRDFGIVYVDGHCLCPFCGVEILHPPARRQSPALQIYTLDTVIVPDTFYFYVTLGKCKCAKFAVGDVQQDKPEGVTFIDADVLVCKKCHGLFPINSLPFNQLSEIFEHPRQHDNLHSCTACFQRERTGRRTLPRNGYPRV
jgi:ribosomal protein L37AE/L43A